MRNLDHGVVFKGEGQPVLIDDDGEEVEAPVAFVAAEGFSAKKQNLVVWRRVLGMFKVTIPVSTKGELLRPELRLLSVPRWILDAIPLYSRWHPVFVRYVDQIAARVRDLGGDPDEDKADPNGDWDGKIRGQRDDDSPWEQYPCCRPCQGCCSHGCGCHPHVCSCHRESGHDHGRADIAKAVEGCAASAARARGRQLRGTVAALAR